MAKRANTNNGTGAQKALTDYRHQAKRKNNPPAKIAAEGTVPILKKADYAYNPHLPPVLRFDPTGGPDALPDLLAKARAGPLSEDEIKLLADALRVQEPWLEWTGKRERKSFEVDPIALHIHERVSTQAILKVAQRQDAARSLFADPEQDYREAVQFYRHDVAWANRLILGDSLQVMSSLARREDLAGKVQMIYMDPPYGIKFASNFQPEVGKRDVKDKQEDLTREPEMVRAYRDTWHLGIHSYLSYLRDRLIVARELLADTGSIFVQISDENLHRVRDVLDEIFGPTNHIVTVIVKKKGNQKGGTLDPINDYLLWYARNRPQIKMRQMFGLKGGDDDAPLGYNKTELASGEIRHLDPGGGNGTDALADLSPSVFTPDQLTSGGEFRTQIFEVGFEGRTFRPATNNSWKLNSNTMQRVANAGRCVAPDNQLRFKKFLSDFANTPLTNLWDDVGGAADKVYVVQTNTKVIARCMLMTTDPGDLVLDPTCGSGTTAYVAEQWGRRWITTDTSRVAIAIARQRLMTAKYDFFKLKDEKRGTAGGFIYKTVPHVTLKSIAQNVALDPIFAKHEPILDAALKVANAELAKLKPDLRTKLSNKLTLKERQEGKRAITDADRRRWILPPDNRAPGIKWTIDPAFGGWYHWEVPFDADPDWPKALQEAVLAYRKAWRGKMDEVNACIAASAEQEELVDQPEVARNVTRVSGPFTVEAVQPPEMMLGDVVEPAARPAEAAGFAGADDLGDLASFGVRPVEVANELEAANVGAYLNQMIQYLRADGVRFLNNRQMKWTRLEPLYESGSTRGFHAEGRWVAVGETDPDPNGEANVGVVIGPQYGPVTAKMIEELIRPASRLYEHLVVAAFNFTAEAQAILSENPHPKLKIHFAHIRPDINPGMNGLLKESPTPGGGQLFTVFGLPRVDVQKQKDGQYIVTMEGVDVYNPVDNSISSTGASKVAAWFLDGDYDGRTFCITQAFFPDRSAWDKLAKALNGKEGLIDASAFEAFSGTTSLPFPAGKHKSVAVKIIDPRGNEVMTVLKVV